MQEVYYLQQKFEEATNILDPIDTFGIEIPNELEEFAQVDDIATKIDVYRGSHDDSLLLASEFWTELGACVGSLEQHDLALKALNKALEIDPDAYGAKVNLAVTYDVLGVSEEALKLIDEVIGNLPDQAALPNMSR